RAGVSEQRRFGFEYYIMLVVSFVECGDLALAEGVVDSCIYVSGRDAKPGGLVTVDYDVGFETAGQLIASCVRECGSVAKFVEQHCGPIVEFIQVGGLEGVLVLGFGHAGADANILAGLKKCGDAGKTGKLSAPAINDLIGGRMPLFDGFKSNEHTTVVNS